MLRLHDRDGYESDLRPRPIFESRKHTLEAYKVTVFCVGLPMWNRCDEIDVVNRICDHQ